MKKIVSRLTFIISFVSVFLFAEAQYLNVKMTPNNASNISEPSICINPRNPDQIVAGSNLNKYYISNDGGFTWNMETLVSPQYGVWGDPVIVCDTAQNFYFFHLANPAVGNWIDRIVCQKYDWDAGTWNDGTYTGLDGAKAQDKHWVTIDSVTNYLHVTWTQFDQYGTSAPDKFSNIMYSRSEDAGETWTDAIQINEISGNCIDSDNTTEGAVPTMGPNGEIYVSWSGPVGIVFDRSLDGGNTWLDNDIPVNDQPGGWDIDIPGIYRANGMPVTCCDLSDSPYRGTIYINWCDQRNGVDDTDVWLSKSTDGGDTWSEPVRVNDDPPGKHQFFTWMTIDQTNGELIFVFYDRRNYDNNNTDVYIARSTDGGETFTNTLISESPFLPFSSVFFGDYTNISAHNGMIRPIWARADGSQMSIWTAIIDNTTDIEAPVFVEPASLDQNYPNPFTNTTFISYKVRRPSEVSLNVYDVFGRKVANLVNNEITEPGKYTVELNADSYQLSSGIYHYILEVGNFNKKQKMIVVD